MIDGHADEQQAPRAPSDGAAAAVSFRGVSKVYGTNVALNDVTVDLPAGCVCGLVGPNGAGKSTLLSIAATLLRPTAGTVEVFGHPIADTAAGRAHIGAGGAQRRMHPPRGIEEVAQSGRQDFRTLDKPGEG